MAHENPPLPYRLHEVTALLLVLSGLAHLGVFAVDGGPWTGPVSWRKPVTFGLSYRVTLLAIVRVSAYLRIAGCVPRGALDTKIEHLFLWRLRRDLRRWLRPGLGEEVPELSTGRTGVGAHCQWQALASLT